MNNLNRVGFYVKNRFEVSYFRTLFDGTDGAVWVGRSRKRLRACGVTTDEPQLVSQFFLRRLMENKFDTIISTGKLPGRRRVSSTKLVMVQYGYAKESYNYGAWRAEADLILAHGDYAEQRFSNYAATVSIGNPRWEDWNKPEFQQNAITKIKPLLDLKKKTVLYAPTWGRLSSLSDWLDEIKNLSLIYNVIVKPHHNSIRDKQISMDASKGIILVPDADLFQLMFMSDVVISDVSGAIFDAILCEKPVVLVNPINLNNLFDKKLGRESLEISCREEFGIVVTERCDLTKAVKGATMGGPTASAVWREHLFETQGNVTEKFKRAIMQLNL